MDEHEIGVFETKTHLSEILRQVVRGERFFITLRGTRVAELRPVSPERCALERGGARNDGYFMAPDFDKPLDDLDDYQ